jgi:hypothetical protein
MFVASLPSAGEILLRIRLPGSIFFWLAERVPQRVWGLKTALQGENRGKLGLKSVVGSPN